MSQSPFASSIWLEAGQGVCTSLLAWSLTCSLAGCVTEAVVAPGWAEWSWWWSLAWLGHLITAGMAIWGLIPLFLHLSCLSTLLQGTERLSVVLRKTFLLQITTSSIAVSLLTDGTAGKLLLLWLAVGPALIASLRQRHVSRRPTVRLCPERAVVLLKGGAGSPADSTQPWPPEEPPPTRPTAR